MNYLPTDELRRNLRSICVAVNIELGSTRLPLIAEFPLGSSTWMSNGCVPVPTTIGEIRASTDADILRAVHDESTAFVRPTTPAEEAIGELRKLRTLHANWDGEGASAPDAKSIETAVKFINALGEGAPVPEPMLSPKGSAGLFWNSDKLYADLEFSSSGRLTYFVAVSGGTHRGGVAYEGGRLPTVITALFSSAADASVKVGRGDRLQGVELGNR